MAQVFNEADSPKLTLRGRTAIDLVSGPKGSKAVSLRLVEVPVQKPGDSLRGPHVHKYFEECMYVVSGEGITHTDNGSYPIKPGEAILVAAGERHVTRNTGSVPLVLLCFFPAPELMVGTEDVAELKPQSRA
jgi:mannose-6-phosphate isomerase-like protein (cupin superfamily)